MEISIEKEVEAIKSKMSHLASNFDNPRKVGAAMHEYYHYRGYLTELKKKYRKNASAKLNERKVHEKDMITSLKTGQAVGMFTSVVSFYPKNEKERDILYKSLMSDIDFQYENIQTHLEFIIDQISTIDKMIFNFETIIKFFDKYVTDKT